MMLNNNYFMMLIEHGDRIRKRNWAPSLPVLVVVVTMAMCVGLCPCICEAAECIAPTGLWKLDEEESQPVFQDAVNPGLNYGYCRQENSVSICPHPEQGRYGIGQKFFTNGMTTGINIPATPIFDWQGNENFSISFWMKRDNTPFEHNEVIIGKNSEEESNTMHWWVGVHETGNANAVFLDKNRSPSSGSKFLRGDKLITDNAWHYIVFVRDGVASENRLYVDGALEDKKIFSYDTPDAFTAPLTDINVGWMNLSPRYYHYKGVVDEIAVYDSALPQWFIRDRYHADERYSAEQTDPCD